MHRRKPTDLGESEIRRIVAGGNIPTLLMMVFQVTGDPKWLGEPYRPTRTRGLGDHDDGGLPDFVQHEIREAAVAAILDLQGGKAPAFTIPSPELTVQMLGISLGEAVGAEYGTMLSSEFALRTGFRRPDTMSVDVPSGFNAVIIGASVSGIIAAKHLGDMNVPYTILEKASSAGGTWRSNNYPGIGVDIPSHLYSFSFAKSDWRKHFELGPELRHYMEQVLHDIGADSHVRFDAEAVAVNYDESANLWHIDVRNADGTSEMLSTNVIISAVGILNSPKLPDVPGIETFAGPNFHSSNWPADLKINNKRVAIVGTGATSMQIVPTIAEQVKECIVFQRSPQWVAPFEKFQKPISEEARALLALSPIYHGWYWLRLFWQYGDRLLESLKKDPDWPYPDRSLNARNDAHRKYFTEYMKDRLGDRSDLLDKTLPDYPPFGKRILMDNGWFEALRRPNVTLVNEAVRAVRPHSVVSSSGAEFEADILVWATGFQAHRFVSSVEVRGIGGTSLREFWNDDDPRAYLAISVPGFPNFFMLGGPHSFPGSGSFMFAMEIQMRYIQKLLSALFTRGAAAIDTRLDVTTDYNNLMDDIHAEMVWTHPRMTTYVRNSRGRVVFVAPFRNVDYWSMVQSVDPADYVFLPADT